MLVGVPPYYSSDKHELYNNILGKKLNEAKK